MSKLHKSNRVHSNTLVAYACGSCFRCSCINQCGNDIVASERNMNSRFSMMLAAMQEWAP